MRTRRWWERALSGLLALWFAMVMVEPAALHTCPTHGGHRTTGTASAHAEHGAMGADAMAQHAGDAASAPEHPAPGAGHQCTCVGDCGAAGLLAPLAARHPALWLPVAVLREARAPRALAVALTPADFVLPFANGPPQLA